MKLSCDQILAAQEQVLVKVALSVGADPRLKPMALVPFRFVVDGHVLEVDPVEAARQGSLDDGELLLLTTAEEMRFAYAFDEDFWQRDRESLVRELSAVWGADGIRLFESYERANPSKTPPEVVCDMITDEGVGDTAQIAEHRAAVGNPAYYAWFSWRSPAAGGRLGACHTLELPFVFNNFANWAKAPMVATADPDEVRQLGDNVQDAWISFVREGTPGPGWPPYELPDRVAMELGRRFGVVNDPVGRRRDLISFLRIDP
jgi:carboxylesterase type B